MTQITDNSSQSTTQYQNLLPLLYQNLNTQLLQLTKHNKQLQAQIQQNSNQHYQQLIKIQKQLYIRLQDLDKQHRGLQNQLEEWLIRYNKLENMEEMYGSQVQNSLAGRLRMEGQFKEERIRDIAYRNRQEERLPEYQAQLQRYRQNSIRYKYLEQKNKQLQNKLIKQKQQLHQLTNPKKQNPNPSTNPHKHPSNSNSKSTNQNRNPKTTRTTNTHNLKKQLIELPLSYIMNSNFNANNSIASKQGRYTLSTISQSRDLGGNVVVGGGGSGYGSGEDLASINQFNI